MSGMSAEEYREILCQIQDVIRRIQERRDECIRVALLARCECGAPVRTAKWVIVIGESPMIERLLCMCDAGHEWFWKFETDVGELPNGKSGIAIKVKKEPR